MIGPGVKRGTVHYLIVYLVQVVPEGVHSLLAEYVLREDLLTEVLEKGASFEVAQSEDEYHAVGGKANWELLI